MLGLEQYLSGRDEGQEVGTKAKSTGHCGDRSHDLEEYRILRTTRSTTEPNAQMTPAEKVLVNTLHTCEPQRS